MKVPLWAIFRSKDIYIYIYIFFFTNVDKLANIILRMICIGIGIGIGNLGWPECFFLNRLQLPGLPSQPALTFAPAKTDQSNNWILGKVK